MFERYNEAVRGVIFLARGEAERFGRPEIETEHFLLGLLSQDKALLDRLLETPVDVEPICKSIRDRTPLGNESPIFVDLPLPPDLESIRQQMMHRASAGEEKPLSADKALSMECKRVLMFTSDEADRLNHTQIGTEHLLLGLLLEEPSLAAEILGELGFSIEMVREDLARRASGG